MSDAGWRPVRRTRTFEEVLAQIEERIEADGLAPGDRPASTGIALGEPGPICGVLRPHATQLAL